MSMTYRKINQAAWVLAAVAFAAAVLGRTIPADGRWIASLASDLLMSLAVAGWAYAAGAYSVLDKLTVITPAKEMSN